MPQPPEFDPTSGFEWQTQTDFRQFAEVLYDRYAHGDRRFVPARCITYGDFYERMTHSGVDQVILRPGELLGDPQNYLYDRQKLRIIQGIPVRHAPDSLALNVLIDDPEEYPEEPWLRAISIDFFYKVGPATGCQRVGLELYGSGYMYASRQTCLMYGQPDYVIYASPYLRVPANPGHLWRFMDDIRTLTGMGRV